MELTIPIIVLTLSAILTVVIIVFQVVRLKKSSSLAIIPDSPKPFGYKMHWYAIKTVRTMDVVEAINLQKHRLSNWEYGLKHLFDLGKPLVFVAPPVHGWTLVLGGGLPFLSNIESSSESKLLLLLSETFGEVQFFSTFRMIETHSWARAIDGNWVRAYSFSPEDRESMWMHGEVSDAEIELGYDLPERSSLGKAEVRWPEENDVMFIAGKWSINPIRLEDYEVHEALGVIGELSEDEIESAA